MAVVKGKSSSSRSLNSALRRIRVSGDARVGGAGSTSAPQEGKGTMGTTIRIAFALAAAFLASGCATSSRQLDTGVDAFEPGFTTLAHATELLGPHASESALPDGARLLRWKFNRSSRPDLPDVAILFDRDGRMRGAVYRLDKDR